MYYRYVSDSVDSQAMMVECVNTSTFGNNISEELKDVLKDSLQSSPLPPKDSYPNPANIGSTPEFNATKPLSSGFRFRSLAVKDSSKIALRSRIMQSEHQNLYYKKKKFLLMKVLHIIALQVTLKVGHHYLVSRQLSKRLEPKIPLLTSSSLMRHPW